MRKIADWIIFILLALCAWSDFRKKVIPLSLLVTMSAVVAVCFFFRIKSPGLYLAGGAVGVLFFIVSRCTHEAIGYGDSWLILLLGIYLGIFSALQVLFAASLTAGVFSLFFLLIRHRKRGAVIPFVPFMALSYLGVVLL